MDASEGADELSGLFPKLASEGFEIVDLPTDRYNCIAFAAGDTGDWWSFHQPEYWPEGATRSNSIDSLVEVFAAIGFEQCDGSGVEPGFEKVALYEQQGRWTHASKQTPNGTWRSKMGEGPVIEHDSPEALSGGPYGNPTIYMRRQAMASESETGPREPTGNTPARHATTAQGLVEPLNPMRASEESTEQRLDRWQKLRDHLRDFGLSKALPDDLLLEPESTTRPNVRLVAHYEEIKQKSLGNSTVAEVAAVVLAAVAVVFSFAAMGTEGSLVLFLVLLAILMRPIMRLLDLMVASKGSLNLTIEELSMSLPSRNRHAGWTDVYAVSVNQRGKRFSRRWPWVRRRDAPCIRVELDDGVVVRLYLCATECEPLANLMRDLVIYHRGDHTAAPEAAR